MGKAGFAETTFAMPALLMGALRAPPTCTIKQEFFAADMLPVKLTLSLL